MALREQIFADLTQAQKSGDVDVVSTLRLLISVIRNKEIEKRAKAGDDPEKSLLDEGEIQSAVQSEIKKRKDAISLYLQGKREDLASKEQKEIEILSKYAPQLLSNDDVRKEVGKVIAEMGAVSIGDLGKVMGQVMSRLKGKVDGSVVSAIVRERLRPPA